MPSRRAAQRLFAIAAYALALGGYGSGAKAPLGTLDANCLSLRDDTYASKTYLVLDSSTTYYSQTYSNATNYPEGYLYLPTDAQNNLCQTREGSGIYGIDDNYPAGLRCDT